MASTPGNKKFKQKTSSSPNSRIAPTSYPKSKSFETDEFPKSITSAGLKDGEFHIDFLKTQFRDLARPNYFKIKINPPSILNSEWNNSLTVLAKSCSFPSIEIQNYELERAGSVLHIPSNKMNYGDFTVTFWNDVDFKIRTLLNRWQRLAVFNWQKDIGSQPLLALEGTITVYQFDSNHKEMYAITLDNCWPKSLSEIQLSYDNVDQAEEFSGTFVFTNHEIYKATS